MEIVDDRREKEEGGFLALTTLERVREGGETLTIGGEEEVKEGED